MCVFCKIVNNEIPGQKVYENDFVAAFLDINPVNPGHVLVVPKNHIESLLAASNEELSHLIIAVKTVAKAVLAALNYEAFNLELNNGAIAGQVVNHLHFHIVPRKEGDGLTHWPGQQYREGEMEAVAEKIRNSLKVAGQINNIR
ncbi:MAG: HIT family protein [Patescibacteria group bacterium]